MSTLIETIGKHQLNYSNVFILAKQLSEQLQVNVQAGYIENFNIDVNKTEEGNCNSDFVLLDSFPYKDETLTFQLIDENYILRQLHAIHGAALFETPFFKANPHYKEEVHFAITNQQYELIEIRSENSWFRFINNIAINWDDSLQLDWWQFWSNFTVENWDKEHLSLNMYRKNQRDMFNLIGCNWVYHVSDQGEIASLRDDNTTWQAIETDIEQKYTRSMFNISAYMKNPEPHNVDDEPLIYFDDFEDFKHLK